jgi:predicted nucleotidyltransferase
MMNPNDPNVVLLEIVAERLGDRLRDDLVFVGGAVAGLLITDPAMPSIRPTEDVDLIVQALARADFHRIERALGERGFVPDMTPQAPVCRWRVGAVTVDVMPTLPDILGFSNRWYPLALRTAAAVSLPSGTNIRLIAAPVFLATKLEAFAGRGNNDFLFSHDLGDLLAVIDGRDSLLAECQGSEADLRVYLRGWMSRLLATPAFLQALPGHLPGDLASQERVPALEGKLRAIAELNDR